MRETRDKGRDLPQVANNIDTSAKECCKRVCNKSGNIQGRPLIDFGKVDRWNSSLCISSMDVITLSEVERELAHDCNERSLFKSSEGCSMMKTTVLHIPSFLWITGDYNAEQQHILWQKKAFSSSEKYLRRAWPSWEQSFLQVLWTICKQIDRPNGSTTQNFLFPRHHMAVHQ